MIPLARGDSGSRKKGEGTGTRANGGAALVDPAKGSPAAPPEFRIPRGPPHDAAAACPGLPLLFYVLTLSWMDVDGRSQFLARFGANPPGILLFSMRWDFLGHHTHLSPLFPRAALYSFDRFPSYLLESFHVLLALCVV